MGYTGGDKADPSYRSLGNHTEAIEVTFDPDRIGYPELLNVFWKSHNPMAAAWSRQYMSAVFPRGPEQARLARESMNRLESRVDGRIATRIIPASTFWQAEDYHQKYYLQMRRDLMARFRAVYPDMKDLVASTAAARVNGYLGGGANERKLREELGDFANHVFGPSPDSDESPGVKGCPLPDRKTG